jgi:hypothetical protein
VVSDRRSHEEQLLVEREAAVRSMKTNLCLVVFFIVSTAVMMLPSQKWETFYYIFRSRFRTKILFVA